MQVVLVMFKSDGERRSFSVARDVTVIGRREDCDLRIPLSEVSRKHCRLIKEADSLRLEDLGSSNGTFHNRVRVQEGTLEPGDTIQVGPVVFTVQMDGVPADDEIVQPEPLSARQATQTTMSDDDGVVLESETGGGDEPPSDPGVVAGGSGIEEFDPLDALAEDDDGSTPHALGDSAFGENVLTEPAEEETPLDLDEEAEEPKRRKGK